ncbi:hypothetical protein [Phenylobacterium soli]|uniref:Fimbrial biogenesis outer membrane usher protein n=1 Tax=Phenylobacterium soli TaxID=2170551 RepID=A0A328AL44_9CAUL|nr:hypothetical protein [Phenylobacterium soli]RAK55191.1 hypothetical protein DJ017_11995 [Phenylobacterium soli]
MEAAGKIDPDGLLLFSVELDKLTLTEGLAAYGDAADPLIPFGELTRLLEYDVEVMPTERRIVGRLGEARTSLVVDLATGTARVGARVVDLTPADVAVTPTDIYLRASAVQRLLPIKLQVNSSELAMVIQPEALLPVQSRLQRLSRDRQNTGGPRFQEEILKVPSPYRAFSMPSFDVSASAGVSSGSASQGPKLPLRYDIRAGADLFYSGLEAYVGSDEQGVPSVARLLLERRSLEGHLLGPLHARVVSVGDVFTPSLAIGPRSLGGRGVSFSTAPLDQTNIFNRIDLRGELPIGYDVELYINDVLQGGQNTPNKGRYEFLNVPLSRGVNVVRIVTYGPHGERSETTRIINVGGGQLKRGEATFEFGAVQQEKALIDLANDGSTDFISRGSGGLRVVGALNYGLTELITVSAGAALTPVTRSSSRGELTLGARTSLFGFLTQLDLGADSTGGTAESLGMAGQLFGVSTVLRYVQLQNGFLDENGPGADFTRPLTSRGEISFDGNAQLFHAVVPLSFRAARTTYADGGVELSGSARGSATVAAALLSGGFEYTHAYGGRSSTEERLTGFFAASTFRSFTWQLRGTVDYDILPDLRPRALAITVDRDISDRASLRFGVGESLESLDQFNLTAAATVRTRVGDLALAADYNNGDQSWRLGAQVNFGLAYDQDAKRYALTRSGPGTGGTVAFHAFYDNNGNGRWDPGEPGVPNVTVEGGIQRVVTGPDGRALVTGLGSSPTARLNVDLDRMDNPSVKSPPRIIQISPRAGQVLQIDYPMQNTSEVLVRILLSRPDGTKVGLSGVRVKLVNAEGHVAEAKTEFDGSANFEELVAGVYQLQLDPEQAQRLRMHLVSPITVTIKGDGGFTPDASAEVKFDPRPQDPTQG